MQGSKLFIATLLFATLGLCLSAYTFNQLGEDARIYRNRQDTLRSLADLRERAAKERGGFERYETLVTNAPIDLAAAVQTIIPGARAEPESPRSEKLQSGWSLNQASLSFDDVSLADAGRLVEYLENQRPPWRLSACEFSATSPGRGRVRLTLETVAR